MRLYNTLTRNVEEFTPIDPPHVNLYTCGPTVYNFAHLGNWRTFIFEDLLVRALQYNGYEVKRVMNITDVGHLTADRDMGEDKVEKEAKKEGKTAWEIADFYTKSFLDGMEKLNLLPADILTKATDNIKEQIALVKNLEDKGYTYKTSDGIYFDTSKLADYGKMATVDMQGLIEGARVEKNPEKKSPTDFALWKFSYHDGRSFDSAQDAVAKRRQMEWDSPWGVGFPGWHIECSAMSLKYLGSSFDNDMFYGERSRTIDIHTGAVDHINVHHTNEIAQSESATGKKFVNYWLHGEFLLIDQGRMGKSEGNFITLDDVVKKGYDPLDFRYFVLGTHYRQQLNFTWTALGAAQTALNNLREIVVDLRQVGSSESSVSPGKLDKVDQFRINFKIALINDLAIPQALALTWDMLKTDIPAPDKLDLLFEFDKILGFNLQKISELEKVLKVPNEISQLLNKREKLRREGKWQEADQIRQEIDMRGFVIEDTPIGAKIKKR